MVKDPPACRPDAARRRLKHLKPMNLVVCAAASLKKGYWMLHSGQWMSLYTRRGGAPGERKLLPAAMPDSCSTRLTTPELRR